MELNIQCSYSEAVLLKDQINVKSLWKEILVKILDLIKYVYLISAFVYVFTLLLK